MKRLVRIRGFESRILSAFRNRVPDRGPGVVRFLVLAMRSRVTRIAAVAALLLTLLQLGRFITHDERPTGFALAPVAALHHADAFYRSNIDTGSNVLATRAMAPKDGSVLEAPERITLSSAGRHDVPVRPSQPAGVSSSFGKFDSPVVGAGMSLQDIAKDRIAGIGNETTHTTGGFKSYDVDPLYQRERAYASAKRAQPASTPSSAETGAPSQSSDSPEVAETSQRKLIRNAHAELEVASFNDTVEKIARLAKDARGYLATSNSQKQENGKLRGEIVVKVLPDSLDSFLQNLREFGELKNQNIGTEDVTKNYFDTTARLQNSRVMEQRLVEMVKKTTGKVSDLLQVEKELGRVREDIEKMQGELKYIDAQVQFATVTITLAEKDMNVPAAFLLEERARVGIFTPDVEKTYSAIKALASTKVQIANARLDSASGGQVSAHISILIAPEEKDSTIEKIKSLGRVQTFEVQTERVSRGGQGMSENAKTEKDKVQVEVTISREQEEQARQQTSLRVLTNDVDKNTQSMRDLVERQGGQVRHSSFNKSTNGYETADLSVRVPMQNYNALMQSLGSLGKVEGVNVHREDQNGKPADDKNAPADVSIRFYTAGNIVADQSGIWPTLRRTLGDGASALMWSVRLIGVALAFLAPWVLALGAVIWIARRIRKARRNK